MSPYCNICTHFVAPIVHCDASLSSCYPLLLPCNCICTHHFVALFQHRHAFSRHFATMLCLLFSYWFDLSVCCPIATYRRPIATFRRPIAALLCIIVAALLRVLSTHCCIVAHYCRPVTAFVCSPNDIAAMLRDLSSYCCDVAHCIALSLHIVAPLLHLNEFCPAIVA